MLAEYIQRALRPAKYELIVMRLGPRKLPIPNPHGGDIDWSLVKRLLDQFGIDQAEWERL